MQNTMYNVSKKVIKLLGGDITYKLYCNHITFKYINLFISQINLPP